MGSIGNAPQRACRSTMPERLDSPIPMGAAVGIVLAMQSVPHLAKADPDGTLGLLLGDTVIAD